MVWSPGRADEHPGAGPHGYARPVAEMREARGSRDSIRRKQILDTALVLFSSKPYEDVSVDDVCADAGVAHGLISYYFGGKRGLFAAAVRQAWKELVDAERPRDDEVSASARVHGFVRRHFEYVSKYPLRFTTLMRTGHADRKVYKTVVGARAEALVELQCSLGCPVKPPAPLRAALRAWMGYLDNMTLDWAAHQDLDIEFVTELCVQALIGAVRASAGQRFEAMLELDALSRVTAPQPAPRKNHAETRQRSCTSRPSTPDRLALDQGVVARDAAVRRPLDDTQHN